MSWIKPTPIRVLLAAIAVVFVLSVIQLSSTIRRTANPPIPRVADNGQPQKVDTGTSQLDTGPVGDEFTVEPIPANCWFEFLPVKGETTIAYQSVGDGWKIATVVEAKMAVRAYGKYRPVLSTSSTSPYGQIDLELHPNYEAAETNLAAWKLALAHKPRNWHVTIPTAWGSKFVVKYQCLEADLDG